MAWNDLIIKVGMDASGFATGTQRIKRDTQGLKDGTVSLSRTITDQRQKLRELWQTQGANSKQYKQLAQDIRMNEKALRDMNRELMNTQRAQGKSKGGMFGDMKSAVIGGIVGGGVAGVAMKGMDLLKTTISDTVTLQIQFDDSMRKVAATAGATGQEFVKLSQAAIKMGSATKFTASQAAEALNYMALAGWNTEQSIAGLGGVLNLAAAAGTDLGTTADIITDTMAAFGLEASRSGEAADIFAKAQSTTNTTVEMLGEAMKYASANAASANQSLKDTATVMGLLANQGIKGSMAGTSFNAMMKDLKKSAVDGKLAFGDYNIALYDADGNFRSIIDIIKEMRAAVVGLTGEQRDALTGGIFEERSIRGVNVLLNTTEADLNKVTSAMNNFSGTAERMANVMEGGLGGATRRLGSAWESLKLSVGDSGAWVGTVNGLADLVNWMNRSTAAATPLANAMEQDRIKAGALIKTIESLNENNEHRAGLIAEVNERYGEYLPNLLSENASINELKSAYVLLNKEFKDKTAAMAQKEQLEGIVTESVRLQKANIELRKRYEELSQASFVFSRETRLGDLLRDIELNEIAIGDLAKSYEDLTTAATRFEERQKSIAKIGLQGAGVGLLDLKAGIVAPSLLPKAMLKAGDGDEKPKPDPNKVKSAAERYKELQGELQKTASFYTFMGKESELAAEQSKMLLRAVEDIYKAGGKGAEQYASKVLEEYNRVKRSTDVAGDMATIAPTRGGVVGAKPELPGMGGQEQFKQGVILMSELRKELAIIGKEATAFGASYDELGARIGATSQAIREAIASGADMEGALVQDLISEYRRLYDEKERQVEQANRLTALSGELANAVGAGFENMASGAMSAGEAMKSVAASMIQVLLKEAAANMFSAAAKQANAASSLGPLGIPIAGAAITAMLGLVRGAMSKTKSVALAKGGLVSGETMALVGDNPNAKYDPEVVSPLSKLQGMIGEEMRAQFATFELPGMQMPVFEFNTLSRSLTDGFDTMASAIEQNKERVNDRMTFEIAGDKLITVMDNAQRKMRAFRV